MTAIEKGESDFIPDIKFVDFFKITQTQLESLLKILLEDFDIIAPIKRKGKLWHYEKISSIENIDLQNIIHTQISFKEWLLPNDQVLLKYGFESDHYYEGKENSEIRKRIIIGLHSCDLHSIKLLDNIFLDNEDFDSAYYRVRSNTLLIGFGCQEQFENCFCGTANTVKPPKNGFDLFFYPDDEGFLVHIGSEKGSDLIKNLNLEKLDEGQEKIETIQDDLIHDEDTGLCFDEDFGEIIKKTYNSDFWTDLGEKCFGCAGCTIVCPTCYCFVVDDIVDLEGEKKMYSRVRNWDSCTLNNWALAAGGHNFQKERGLRLNRRFMHKFSQIRAKQGRNACVGCGRCISICPTGAANPVTVLKNLKEYVEMKKLGEK